MNFFVVAKYNTWNTVYAVSALGKNYESVWWNSDLAAPYTKQPDTHDSFLNPGFSFRAVRMWFEIDKVTLWQVFLGVLLFSSACLIMSYFPALGTGHVRICKYKVTQFGSSWSVTLVTVYKIFNHRPIWLIKVVFSIIHPLHVSVKTTIFRRILSTDMETTVTMS
jgi:hypothetical protein